MPRLPQSTQLFWGKMGQMFWADDPQCKDLVHILRKRLNIQRSVFVILTKRKLNYNLAII